MYYNFCCFKVFPQAKQNKKKKIYKIYSSAFVWNILIPFLERKWKICGKTVTEHIITGSYNKDNITFTTLLFKLFLLNFSLWFAITLEHNLSVIDIIL